MANRIVRILMRRDGISEEDAQMQYDDVKEEIRWLLENDGGLWKAEEEVRCNLGLEPDYLMDILEDLGV